MKTKIQFNPDTLVWKQGMKDWIKAGSVDELSSLFDNPMPPIPEQD
ncbi:hypothetical protein HMPREF9176_0496 [Streptococcus downei F0415]|nr:hypothetical protein HMPREF9176_0496 [Streptococcus downei F0415]